MTMNGDFHSENHDEFASSLFQQDELLAHQYLDTLRNRAELDPEKSLVLAVLEDAVICFQKYLFAESSSGQALFDEAEAWFLDDREDSLFSFRVTCEILGIDPDWVRKGLTDWKRRQRKYGNAA